MVRMESGPIRPAAPRYAPSVSMRLVQLLLIVLIFTLVGPVVGTIVITTMMGLISGTASGIPGAIILGLLTGAAFVLGAVPAAIAGALIGLKQAWFGGSGWRFALGAGALVGLGQEIHVHGGFIPAGNERFIGVPFVVCTVSTLACWRVVKTWSFLREANP